MNKRKKDFKFYWEEEPKKETQRVDESLEFTFTFPQMQLPAMKLHVIPMHISETEKDIVIRVNLPGFKKEEISLNATQSTIEINALKKHETVEQGKKHYRHESSSSAVQRSFTLPALVDPDKTRAKLEDGLLTIAVPKLEHDKKKKKKVEVR